MSTLNMGQLSMTSTYADHKRIHFLLIDPNVDQSKCFSEIALPSMSTPLYIYHTTDYFLLP